MFRGGEQPYRLPLYTSCTFQKTVVNQLAQNPVNHAICRTWRRINRFFAQKTKNDIKKRLLERPHSKHFTHCKFSESADTSEYLLQKNMTKPQSIITFFLIATIITGSVLSCRSEAAELSIQPAILRFMKDNLIEAIKLNDQFGKDSESLNNIFVTLCTLAMIGEGNDAIKHSTQLPLEYKDYIHYLAAVSFASQGELTKAASLYNGDQDKIIPFYVWSIAKQGKWEAAFRTAALAKDQSITDGICKLLVLQMIQVKLLQETIDTILSTQPPESQAKLMAVLVAHFREKDSLDDLAICYAKGKEIALNISETSTSLPLLTGLGKACEEQIGKVDSSFLENTAPLVSSIHDAQIRLLEECYIANICLNLRKIDEAKSRAKAAFESWINNTSFIRNKSVADYLFHLLSLCGDNNSVVALIQSTHQNDFDRRIHLIDHAVNTFLESRHYKEAWELKEMCYDVSFLRPQTPQQKEAVEKTRELIARRYEKNILEAIIADGDMEWATLLTEQIRSPINQIQAKGTIAALLEKTDVEKARLLWDDVIKNVKALPDTSDDHLGPNDIFGFIAVDCVTYGHTDRFASLLNFISDPIVRNRVCILAASTLASKKDFDTAIAIYQMAKRTDSNGVDLHLSALANFCEKLFESNRVDDLVVISKDGSSGILKDVILAEIAICRIRNGNLKMANEILPTIKNGDSIAWVHSSMVKYFLENGRIDDARKSINSIKDQGIKLKCIIKLSEEIYDIQKWLKSLQP